MIIAKQKEDAINNLTDPEKFFNQRHEWLTQTIAAYVAHESPTRDADRVQALGEIIEADCRRIGATIKAPPISPRPVVATFGSEPADLCLVFHHDTVWPVGSFSRSGHDGNRWYGPGIFDMKANIPLMILCLEYLGTTHPHLREKIMLLSSPDEEVMGPGSRKWVTQLGEGCEWGLVFEPPMPDGAFKQRRKGLGKMRIQFQGIASHAGNHYSSGKSALAAAARFLLEAEGLTDLKQGMTVNVGLLKGGSASNTRPAFAEMDVDVRVVETSQWDAFQRFRDGYVDSQGVHLEDVYRTLLPPMNAFHEGWTQLASICQNLNQPFTTGRAGGGSDGSNLAAVGVKVLDGLGIPGAGEHAEHEHILTDQLYPCFLRNVQLLVGLLS